jgi:hypothetical protein
MYFVSADKKIATIKLLVVEVRGGEDLRLENEEGFEREHRGLEEEG